LSPFPEQGCAEFHIPEIRQLTDGFSCDPNLRAAEFEKHKLCACIFSSDVRKPSGVGGGGFGEAVLRWVR
ncbi:MAG: hypothetical protein ACREB3_00570, partial [Burkholderiales bacterium]